MSIKPLPSEVIAQIKSSTLITCLNGVIIELVKNSLDASATKVHITVDHGRGGCTVEDDGLGIPPREFQPEGNLGRLWHSSKLDNHNTTHGHRGTFLASLSALSLLSIVSHHHAHRSHNAISLYISDVVARQIPVLAPQHLVCPNHGTRVTVRDLFGSMPVRVKQRAVVADSQQLTTKLWKDMCKEVVMLLLAWPSAVSAIIRRAGSTERIIIRGCTDSENRSYEAKALKTCSILAQAQLILPGEGLSWVPVSATTAGLSLSGTISLQPNATKQVQFFALGFQPIVQFDGPNVLYDEVNHLFASSAFGGAEELAELHATERIRRAADKRYTSSGYTTKELKGSQKGVDRWPMYYINIQLQGTSILPTNFTVDNMLDGKGDGLNQIISLLRLMITEFLVRHHFRPQAKRQHRSPSQPFVTKGRTPSNSSKGLGPHPDVNLSKKKEMVMDSFGQHSVSSWLRSSSISPFESWSRVKSGTVSMTSAQKVIEELSDREARNEDAQFRPANSSISRDLVTHGARSSGPLVNKNGKITRRPFHDVIEPLRSRSAPPQKRFSVLGTDQFLTGHVSWVNPVTKIRSLIDQRTGYVLPQNRKGEIRSTRLTHRKFSTHVPKAEISSAWIQSVLKDWENPIYPPSQHQIPHASSGDGPDPVSQRTLHGKNHNCSQVDIERAFKEPSAGNYAKISKHGLREAGVIAQVDRKFILIRVRSSSAASIEAGQLLVLIDQHAADERIRIEALLAELCTSSSVNSSQCPVLKLDNSIPFELPPQEAELFSKHAGHFYRWGFSISQAPISKNSKTKPAAPQTILVNTLPRLISERCKSSPKLLISLLRTELHAHSAKATSSIPSSPQCHQKNQNEDAPLWVRLLPTIPEGILNLLNSRACRGAIMFNDVLSIEECEVLVGRLAECKFPFRCAHGRPSLVPVADLGMVGAMGIGNGLDEGIQMRGLGSWVTETKRMHALQV